MAKSLEEMFEGNEAQVRAARMALGYVGGKTEGLLYEQLVRIVCQRLPVEPDGVIAALRDNGVLQEVEEAGIKYVTLTPEGKKLLRRSKIYLQTEIEVNHLSPEERAEFFKEVVKETGIPVSPSEFTPNEIPVGYAPLRGALCGLTRGENKRYEHPMGFVPW